jgi:hypothetical protein
MKFLRLNEYHPVRTAEVIEALSVYDILHEIRNEIRAAKANGRVITASMNLFSLKIAKTIESQSSTTTLLSNMAEELAHIKAKNPDPEGQKQAISSWLFGPRGHWTFLWESLYENYLPRLTKALVRGFGGTPPVDEEAANDIAMKAIGEFMEQKDSASVVSALAQFDSSKGSLMTWLEGGIRWTTQRMVRNHLKLQNSETSTNQKIGDNDDTEMGEMLPDKSAEDPFDIVDYTEKTDRLISTFARYRRTLKEQIEHSDNPAEKFKLQNLLQHISNPANDVSQKIATLKNTATDIDIINDELADTKSEKQKLFSTLSGKNPDANTLNMAKTYIEKFKQKIIKLNTAMEKKVEAFNAIYSELNDMAQYDAETGATRIEPEMPAPAPMQQEVAPGVEAEPGEMAPEQSPIVDEPMMRTKAIGNRVILSPADQKIMEDRMRASRDKLRPEIYRSVSFPDKKRDLKQRSNNLFNLKEVSDNITTQDDLDHLIQGDFSKASVQAIYSDIFVRGMLYVRDQAAMDKAYSPEIISDSEEMRRALSKFSDFVINEVNNNPNLQAKEAEYKSLPAQEQIQVASSLNNLSPVGYVLHSLKKLVDDDEIKKDGTIKTQAGKENKFRTLYEYFDHAARASAYGAYKDEALKDENWEKLTDEEKAIRIEEFKKRGFDDLTDEERARISKKVYEDQYGAGHRGMSTGRLRDKSIETKKFEPRYPQKPDTDGSRYQEIMNRELWRIGREKARGNPINAPRYPDEQHHQYRNPAWGTDSWYEISDNPEDFKNANKPQKGDTLAQSGVIEFLLRIANEFDNHGFYREAEMTNNDIKRLIHG